MSAEFPQHSLDSVFGIACVTVQRLGEYAKRIERERDYLLAVLRDIADAPVQLEVPDWIDTRVRDAISRVGAP